MMHGQPSPNNQRLVSRSNNAKSVRSYGDNETLSFDIHEDYILAQKEGLVYFTAKQGLRVKIRMVEKNYLSIDIFE